MGTEETCAQCGHASGRHILAATLFTELHYEDGPNEIPAGGHMYCPEPGCECHGTWSIPDDVAGFDVKQRLAGQPPPDAAAIRRIRGH